MRMIVEIVILAALLIVLTALPGRTLPHNAAAPVSTPLATATPGQQGAAFDAFAWVDAMLADAGASSRNTPQL